MQKKINIGLIGYGVVGKRRILSLTNKFNVVACADPYIKINKIKLDKKNIYIANKNYDITNNLIEIINERIK